MAEARSSRRIPPPIWFAGALVVQRIWMRRRRSTAVSRTAAAALTAGSAAIAISAVATMRKAGTTISPENPERASTLVTEGSFRVTRNPIYLALAGVLVAHAVLRRSAGALVPAAGFVLVLDRTQIPAEERALRSRFGRAYDCYSRETPRWV